MELEKPKCTQCELPLLPTDRFCPFCGRRQPNPIPWEKRVAKGVTLILFIFMGLPAGLLGCCGLASLNSSYGSAPALAVFGSIAVFAFALWLFIRAWKK